MSTSGKKKKKVIVSNTAQKGGTKTKKKIKPTVSKKVKSPKTTSTLIYNKENFKWMFIGLAFIALGMILMSGGAMPSPDVWNEDLIYSPRRITIAPIIILIGLGIEIYAIFK